MPESQWPADLPTQQGMFNLSLEALATGTRKAMNDKAIVSATSFPAQTRKGTKQNLSRSLRLCAFAWKNFMMLVRTL
jgi:hypothetical protein